MKKLVSLVLLGVLTVGCGDSPVRPTVQPLPNPSPAPTGALYAVSGLVTTSDGGAVEGAIVTVGDDFDVYLTGTTDIEGRYSFSGLAAGVWQLTVSKEGFETMTTRIELSEDMSLDVQLPTAGSYSARSRARAK
jgi:Carboxypeptidase regulatory-like domain